MRAVLGILFGVAFTTATAWALGAVLLRRLSVVLYRVEERLFAFLLGSACLSAIMFVLAALHLVHKGVLLAIGILAIGYAFYSGAHRLKGNEFPPLPRLWKWVFSAIFAVFTVLYFSNALAPEVSPDGMAYHLGEVAKYARAHGFVRITTNMYGNLSQGIELLFLYAFIFGKHSAAAMVHFVFLLCLAFLMLSYGRRLGHPAMGVAGGLFVYASSVIGIDGISAYNDVAAAAIAFALFYLLQIWDEQRSSRLLVPIGILTGFAFAAKYTAFVAVPYTLGFIAWKLWRARQAVIRPVLATSALALIFIAPWLLKSWIWVDNPFSPFANRLFPNPYVHISFEEEYRHLEQNYDLTSHWQIPRQVTIKGELLEGLFGPLFLLAPLGLLALRRPAGRQLWLGALVFGLPYYANIGTRFLIPAAPFVSLALALTFVNVQSILLALTLAHAISCWPSVEKRYCGQYAWRINDIPWKAALRIEPEDVFISERSRPYNESRMIDQLVPKGERVFSFAGMADAYTSREILVGYQGAFNEIIRDILWTPMFTSFQPTRILTFRFSPREMRAIRVVQTESAKDAQWDVFELRIMNAGSELARAPDWRLRARPNPWDVQMAFDNSPVTRWRSWEVAKPGMFIQVDFGRVQKLDGVVSESSGEVRQTKIKLEGMDAQGRWATISDQPVESTAGSRVNLRQAASAELKARGIHYILVEKSDYRSEDFQIYARLWGIKCIGHWDANACLYHIE